MICKTPAHVDTGISGESEESNKLQVTSIHTAEDLIGFAGKVKEGDREVDNLNVDCVIKNTGGATAGVISSVKYRGGLRRCLYCFCTCSR